MFGGLLDHILGITRHWSFGGKFNSANLMIQYFLCCKQRLSSEFYFQIGDYFRCLGKLFWRQTSLKANYFTGKFLCRQIIFRGNFFWRQIILEANLFGGKFLLRQITFRGKFLSGKLFWRQISLEENYFRGKFLLRQISLRQIILAGKFLWSQIIDSARFSQIGCCLEFDKAETFSTGKALKITKS